MPQIKFNPQAAKTSQFSTQPSYAERAGQENLDRSYSQASEAAKESSLTNSLMNLGLGYELGGGEIVKPISDAVSSLVGSGTAASSVASPVSSFASSIPSSFGTAATSPTYTLGVPNAFDTAPMESVVTTPPTVEPSGMLQGLGDAASVYAILYGGGKAYQGIQKGSRTETAKGGAVAGAGIGFQIGGPVGAIIGAVAGSIGGALLGHIKTGKSKDQQKRDAVRDAFQKGGLIDQDYNIHLADGSVYNIGVDGGPKPEYGNMHPYELDLKDPLVASTIPAISPLVMILTGGDQKATSDFTGYLVRAAMSNAGGDPKKIDQNIRAFYAQIHADAGIMKQALDQLKSQGKINDQQYNVYMANVARVAPSAPNGNFQMPTFSMPTFNMPEQKIPPSPPPGVVDNSGALNAAFQSYQNTYGQGGGLQAAFNNLSGNYNRSGK